MKRPVISIMAFLALASLVIAGCTQAAPAPTPVQTAGSAVSPAAPTKAAEPAKPAAAAAPTKAAEPTKAPAAQPTAAPVKKVDFPQKGRSITGLVPFAAGGSTDVSARLLAAQLEKELGVPVQIVNRTGGGTQVAMTELANARPDGYTMAWGAMPTSNTAYLDPERKAVYGRKSFAAVARTTADPIILGVRTESPYKTLKDLLDAAKARPDQIKLSVSGLLSVLHLTMLQLEQLSGARFAPVTFDGSAPGITAMLGGHIDGSVATAIELLPHAKAGTVRVLGIAGEQRSKFWPDVPTMESQGYKVSMLSSHMIEVPAGTPKEVVDILSGAIKKALENEDLVKKMTDAGLEPRYMNAAQVEAFWDQLDTQLLDLMKLAKR